MPKSYSVDLRERVLKHLEKNPDKKAASILFQVGIATVFRWVARKKIMGTVEPLRRKYAYKKIGSPIQVVVSNFYCNHI